MILTSVLMSTVTLFNSDFPFALKLSDFSVFLCADYESVNKKYSLTHDLLWKTTFVTSKNTKICKITNIQLEVWLTCSYMLI